MKKTFEEADFYSMRDPETLDKESVEEALEELVESWVNPGDTAEAVRQILEKQSPLVVRAYARQEIPDLWVLGRCESMAENLAEDFAADYGDEGGGDNGFTEEVLKEMAKSLEKVVREALTHATVWPCDEVASKTYTVDEAMQILKESGYLDD